MPSQPLTMRFIIMVYLLILGATLATTFLLFMLYGVMVTTNEVPSGDLYVRVIDFLRNTAQSFADLSKVVIGAGLWMMGSLYQIYRSERQTALDSKPAEGEAGK